MADKLKKQLVNRRVLELLDEPTSLQKFSYPRQEVFSLPGLEGDISTLVPHPPQFQPQPTVVGKDVGKAISTLLKIAPSLQGRINRVQMGPTDDVMGYLDAANKRQGTHLKPENFEGLNLLGLTNIMTGNISLNPRTGGEVDPMYSIPATLAHEVTHAAGYPDEARPEEAARSLVGTIVNGKDNRYEFSPSLLNTLLSRIK